MTVVVTCFDENRFDLTVRSIRSVLAQDYPHELVVVVDHNEQLESRLRAHLPGDVRIRPNDLTRGASGARNAGGLPVATDLVAFLDDDAQATPGWLAALVRATGGEAVVGAGGRIDADWPGAPPRWFPPLFSWVVGATITSGIDRPQYVRNVWAGNMIVKAERFRACQGFRESWGKIGHMSEPEDTELSLRLATDGGRWRYTPEALVRHHVPTCRTTPSFFLRRCWVEGRGKARLYRIASGSSESLSSERDYLRHAVPGAVRGHLGEAVRGDLWGGARAAMCMVGSGVTALAFLVELQGRPRSR